MNPIPSLVLALAAAQAPPPATRPAPAAPPAQERELTPAQVEARSLAQQSLARFQNGDRDRCEQLARKAQVLDGAYELAPRILGWCAVARGDDAAACELLTTALNLEPANLDVQFLLATCHRRLGEWGAAKDLLQDVLKKQGAGVPVLRELAECCAGEGDTDGALAVLRQARALAPQDRETALQAVAVLERAERFEEAARELRPLVAAAPGEAPLRWRLIQCLLDGQAWRPAATELEEAARVLPEDPQPRRVLVHLYGGPLSEPARLAVHQEWLKQWNLRRR